MMRVFSLQFSPQDDDVFVSGGWDDTIQVSYRMMFLIQI